MNTLRSILVAEETDEYITLRAASETGTVWSAIRLWFILWRHRWFPYRWYAYEEGNNDWGAPNKTGWRWRKKDFLVKHHGN